MYLKQNNKSDLICLIVFIWYLNTLPLSNGPTNILKCDGHMVFQHNMSRYENTPVKSGSKKKKKVPPSSVFWGQKVWLTKD